MSRDFDRDEAVVRALREALDAEARQVMPAGDGLMRIREKTQQRRTSWRRFRWLHGAEMLGAAAAVSLVIAVATGVVTGALHFGGSSTPGHEGAQIHTMTTPTAEPTPTPSPTTATTGGPVREVTLFYVGHTDGRPYLFAELHQRPKPDSGAVIRDSIEAMLTERPDDPSYSSPWPSGTKILGISHHGTVVVVDLSKEAADGPKGLGTFGAQQLLATVRSAVTDAPDTTVALQIDGKKVRSLWGDLVAFDHGDPDGPVITVDDAAFAPVQILAPAWGAKLDGRPQNLVTFGGTATVFEGSVSWQILDTSGSVVVEGTEQASSAMSGTWWFSRALDPGTYTFRAFEASAKDGTPLHVTSKVFTAQ